MSDRQPAIQIQAQEIQVLNSIQEFVNYIINNNIVDILEIYGVRGDDGVNIYNIPYYQQLEENILLLNDFRNRER